MFILLNLRTEDPVEIAVSDAVALLTTSVLPVLMMQHHSVKYGNTKEDAIQKGDRVRPLVSGMPCYLLDTALLSLAGRTAHPTAMMFSYTANTVIVLLISTHWKISIHVIVAVGPALDLSYTYFLWDLITFALLPLVA